MSSALLVLALSACAASAPEELRVPEHQTVYQCGSTGHVIGEWCFGGTADELAPLVHAPCWESEDERFCVGPLGQCFPVCLYCCGPDCGPGCNALQGCRC